MAPEGPPELFDQAELDAVCERVRLRIYELLPDPEPPTNPRTPGVGQAVQAGPHVPEYGPGWYHVECDDCGATWVGIVGDDCGWCERRLDRNRPSVPTPPTVPGWNYCPTHDHLWQGLRLEVCGAHGGPFSCNQRGEPATRALVDRLVGGADA